MNNQAMDYCRMVHGPHSKEPVTYMITDRYSYDHTPTMGRVVEWGIRCGNAPAVATKSKQPSEC